MAIMNVFPMLNGELSRSRRRVTAAEANEQRISHRDHKQKGWRLSAPAIC